MINVGNAYFTGFEKRKSNYKYLDYSHPLINFFSILFISSIKTKETVLLIKNNNNSFSITIRF